MIRMVSIDSSTRCTGMAYFQDGALKIHDVINLSGEKDIEKRSDLMGLKIMQNLFALSPSIVYVERPRGRNNPETLRKLTTIVGMIRGFCIYNGIYFEEIAPTEWRKILGFKQGKGVKRDEEKLQSVQYVKDRYNINPKTDDESDAICIGDAMFAKYAELMEGKEHSEN